MTGGIASRSTSSSAVRTLMELTMATAAIVLPGPTGVSRPSTVTSASADGVHRSMTRSASSRRRLPTIESGASDMDCSTDVTATTRMPRWRAPRAISTGTADNPPAEKTMSTSIGPNEKFERMTSARPGRALDEHCLALAVGADHLRVERHRQLDHRVEAGVRAVAREHLLDRDPRVAGPEEMDEAVRCDRIGAPLARGLDRLALCRGDPIEDSGRLGHPGKRSCGSHGH